MCCFFRFEELVHQEWRLLVWSAALELLMLRKLIVKTKYALLRHHRILEQALRSRGCHHLHLIWVGKIWHSMINPVKWVHGAHTVSLHQWSRKLLTKLYRLGCHLDRLVYWSLNIWGRSFILCNSLPFIGWLRDQINWSLPGPPRWVLLLRLTFRLDLVNCVLSANQFLQLPDV